MWFFSRRHSLPTSRPHSGGDDASLSDPPVDEIIPDELVDRVLDREVPPDDSPDVLSVIRMDPAADERLESTREILRDLRSDRHRVDCPDLSGCILARISASKGLFSSVGLRRVCMYRYAAAAVLLLAIAALFVAQRAAPDAVRLTSSPAPVGRIVSAVPSETADVFSGVKSVFASFRSVVPSPGPSPVAVRRVIDRNRLVIDDWSTPVNPPIAAILWVDDGECLRSSRSGCRGTGECRGSPLWAGEQPTLPYGGVLTDDARRPRRDSGVVFVTFSR